MVKLLGVTFCVALLSVLATCADAKKMVCYFGSWSVYRPGAGKFDVENIDPNLCTHLMFGFVGLSDEPGIRVLDAWNELYDNYGKGAFVRFANLKARNPSLKVLVAIGGWNEGSIKYSQAFASPAKRAIFVQKSVEFIQKYGFDGLDLDWEYPAQRGGVAADKEVFTELIKALRTEFDKHGYLLTAAVAAAEFSMSVSYDVKALGTYLDFINVMTYDMHGAWEDVTGHNAPLYAAQAEKGSNDEFLNVHESIQVWLKYGAPAEKLVMGVGIYGRSFSLASTSCVAPRCPSKGKGWAGPWTREEGIMGYYEICKLVSDPSSQLYWDDEAMVPYLVKGDQWIGYDDKRSVQLKIDYILSMNLGGAMIWSIDTDDFTGACGMGRYPLLTQLKNGVTNGIGSGTVPPTAAPTTAAPTTAGPTTAVPTTAAPTSAGTTAEPTTAGPTSAPDSGDTPCTSEGYIRDAEDCAKFYRCKLVSGKYTYTAFSCSGGLMFDTTRNVCNYADKVTC